MAPSTLSGWTFVARRDCTLAGTRIPAGATLHVHLTAAHPVVLIQTLDAGLVPVAQLLAEGAIAAADDADPSPLLALAPRVPQVVGSPPPGPRSPRDASPPAPRATGRRGHLQLVRGPER